MTTPIRIPTEPSTGMAVICATTAAQIVGLTDVLARIAALETHTHIGCLTDDASATGEWTSGMPVMKPETIERPAPVTAARPDTLILNPHGPPTEGNGAGCLMTQQPAGDDAAVAALSGIIWSEDHGSPKGPKHIRLGEYGARAILFAIRRGEVPTICNLTTNEMTLTAEINALRAELAESVTPANEMRFDLADAANELTAVRGKLAEAERLFAMKETDRAEQQRVAMECEKECIAAQNRAYDLETKQITVNECHALLDLCQIERADAGGRSSLKRRIEILNDEACQEQGKLERALSSERETCQHLSDIIASRDAAIKKLEADLETHQSQWQVVRVIAERDKALADLAEAYASLDMQCKSNEHARARYDTAHPDEAGKWPDRTDMVAWMMDDHDKMAGELAEAKLDAARALSLAGLLGRARVMVEEITIRMPRHVSREYGPQDPLGAHALLQEIDAALAKHGGGK